VLGLSLPLPLPCQFACTGGSKNEVELIITDLNADAMSGFLISYVS
jgi:hypothetical protein